MSQKIYQVDAFANQVFSGNPAAVCPLEKWLSDALLQKIAMENNQAETAFFVREGTQFHIRWFTPAVEVDLCGHATLASAFVLFNQENYPGSQIDFYSAKSGKLTVTRNGDFLTLHFPADEIEPVELSGDLISSFDLRPVEAYKGKSDYMLVFEKEEQIKNIRPAFEHIARLHARGVIITARGDQSDFVSRFFGPQVGIMEDPVTGSAHTTLIPYWAGKLNKNELTATQISPRRGYLYCKNVAGGVEISGQGKLYMKGHIFPGT
jgi:PhzF family phenazine biosynthesis protein